MGLMLQVTDRCKRRLTFPTHHSPPRLVLIPLAVNSAAIALSEVCPDARISASTSARSAAKAAAFTDTVARSATPPFPARRRLSAPFGFPSFTPRALATASASFVRREIASRSACATSAMIPTVRSFASGMSTATNLTPLSRKASRKAALRDSRSSFAMTSVAPVTFARCSAFASSGQSALLTARGKRIDKKHLYRMLSNRAYIGEAVHKGDSYPCEHDAIIDRELWDRVHLILKESPRTRSSRTRAQTPALLKGLVFGPDGAAFSPTHTRKLGRLYRYYVSQSVLKFGKGACPIGRVPAGDLEAAVINQLRAVFRQPEIIAGTWKAARAHDASITEADASAALQRLDPLWDELFPAEQARIVGLLVERVDIGADGLNVRLRMAGLSGLARELLAGSIEVEA
jgi:Recombinase